MSFCHPAGLKCPASLWTCHAADIKSFVVCMPCTRTQLLAVALQVKEQSSLQQQGRTCSSDMQKLGTHTNHIAISKIRGKLKVRSMANLWRRRANNKALPALRPFIPHIVREEIIAMAQWCVFLLHRPLPASFTRRSVFSPLHTELT